MTNINAYSSENTYTIAATVNPAESGTVQGTGTYGDGTICTLIATAIEGFTFVNWTENGNQVSTETQYSFTVNSDRTLQANFVSNQANTYVITATANPTNGGTVTGAGSYEEGSSCTLTAAANEGYTFVNWMKNDAVVSSNATYTFTVMEAATYIANFEIQGAITNHWTPVPEGLYSQSTTIKGVILFNGVEQFSNQLELGIFCGDECRGSVTLVDNVWCIRIWGNVGDNITLRFYCYEPNRYMYHSIETIVLKDDEHLGTFDDPRLMSFDVDK
jgi:hypothetical protein